MLRFHLWEWLLIWRLIYKKLQCWGVDLIRQLYGLEDILTSVKQVWCRASGHRSGVFRFIIGFLPHLQNHIKLEHLFCFSRFFSMDWDSRLTERPPKVGGGSEGDTWSSSACSPILISSYRGPSMSSLKIPSKHGGAVDPDPYAMWPVAVLEANISS